MQRDVDTKDAIDYVEDSASRKQAFVDDEMPLPLLLEGLGPDELNKIGKRATWKLDLIIMPAMTMYAKPSMIAWACRVFTDIAQQLHPQLPRSAKHSSSQAGRYHGRFGVEYHSVQHGGQRPVRWI